MTIPLNAKREGNVIQVQGILAVTTPDYGIDNPSGGPTRRRQRQQMEFVLQLQRA